MLPLWHFFLERKQFTFVLMAALVVGGVFSIVRIPKESSPAISIPYATVVTTLAGASATDMETLVTNKLEDQVSGISNIEKLTSSSGAGVSSIVVQFEASADANQSLQDLRDAVAKVNDLPSDASTPSVSKVNYNDQPVIVASISVDLPSSELSTLGTTISDDLKRIVGVSKVDVTGVPDRQVTVIVNKEALEQYGVSLVSVVSSIQSSNAALPAGSLSVDGVNYTVNFKGGLTDPEQINTLTVGSKNGSPIYLRDVATIADGLAPESTYARLSQDGKPSNQAITFNVYKQSGASMQTVATAVREKFTELQKTDLKDASLYISNSTDQGYQVGEQLGELVKTGIETVILVLIVLLITIGWRESLVAALSIPLSFLIAFIGLYLTDNTLNFISLFALILAVGILVDSGIVVTEAIHARMGTYRDSMKAAYAALADYAWPLISGTMATVAVFAPLFFISGIIGKFLAGIPYTIIFVLFASIVVALGFVPLIAILLTRRGHETDRNRVEVLQEEYTERVTTWYREKLRTLLTTPHYQKWFLRGLIIALLLSCTLPFVGLLKLEFFPQSDADFVTVSIQTPQGTTLENTDLVVRTVEEILYTNKDIASFQTSVGQGSAYSSGSSGSNQASITVNLPEGHKASTEVVTELQKELASVTSARIQVTQQSSSPSSGAPIQIQFKGNDLSALTKAAAQGKNALSSTGATNITSTTDEQGIEFDLSIDRAKAAALGVSPSLVAQTLRIAINGSKATTVTLPNENIDVVVKLNLNPAYSTIGETSYATLDSVKSLTVQGTNGPVLLGSILTDTLAPSNTSISHEDKVRTETVSAYPADGSTTSEVLTAFKKEMATTELPDGVHIVYSGESEDMSSSFSDMFVALIAGLLLMFLILIIGFNSFRYTLYLLCIVPLSLIGVLVGLTITGQSISLTSLLGVVALGGVIINHANILMDSLIERLREEGDTRPLVDIVVDSAAQRLRPIVLTTVTTVIGMVPLALSDPSWGPLAYAIMFGLSFAIILTLALVPMLFYRAPHLKKYRERK